MTGHRETLIFLMPAFPHQFLGEVTSNRRSIFLPDDWSQTILTVNSRKATIRLVQAGLASDLVRWVQPIGFMEGLADGVGPITADGRRAGL